MKAKQNPHPILKIIFVDHPLYLRESVKVDGFKPASTIAHVDVFYHESLAKTSPNLCPAASSFLGF